MLSDELRTKMVALMRTEPQKAVKEIEAHPEILSMLLNDSASLQQEKNEKIKYIILNQRLEAQIDELAKRLNISKGLLLGAGAFLLVSAFSKQR